MKVYLAFMPEEPDGDRDPMDMPEWLDTDPVLGAAKMVKQMQERFAAILAEEPVRFTPEVINVMAQMERRQRMTDLAAQSAAQMDPNPTIHAQINRMLDETDIKYIPRGRPAVSREMEDD